MINYAKILLCLTVFALASAGVRAQDGPCMQFSYDDNGNRVFRGHQQICGPPLQVAMPDSLDAQNDRITTNALSDHDGWGNDASNAINGKNGNGVGEVSQLFSDHMIRTYPVPFDHSLEIQGLLAGATYQVELVSVPDGKQVRQWQNIAGVSHWQFNLSALSPGAYLLRVSEWDPVSEQWHFGTFKVMKQ